MTKPKLYIKVVLAFLLFASLQLESKAQIDPFVGEIRMFGGNFAPRGWLLCEGQLLPIVSYQALFSLLGTTYGGDGRTTFALPDLRGRAPIHHGGSTGTGLSTYNLGSKVGTETRTLTVQQIPSHTHTATASAQIAIPIDVDAGSLASPETAVLAKSSDRGNIYSTTNNATLAPISATPTITMSNTGSSVPIDIRQPSLAINYIIAIVGIFPSRN